MNRETEQFNFEICETRMNNETVNAVNARELWLELDSKQQFADWIKKKIKKYGFIEGEDYLLHNFMKQLPSGAKLQKDYLVSLEMAKELAMVENNEKGRAVRRYFIEMEKAHRQHLEYTGDFPDESSWRRCVSVTYEVLDALRVIADEFHSICEMARAIGIAERTLHSIISGAQKQVYYHTWRKLEPILQKFYDGEEQSHSIHDKAYNQSSFTADDIPMERAIKIGDYAASYPYKWPSVRERLQNPLASMGQIAKKLGIAKTTVCHHLNDASKKIMGDLEEQYKPVKAKQRMRRR